LRQKEIRLLHIKKTYRERMELAHKRNEFKYRGNGEVTDLKKRFKRLKHLL